MSFSSKINGFKEMWQFDNRWHLIFSRLFFHSQHLLFYKYKNIEFVTDHFAGEANGALEVVSTNMYRDFLPLMNLKGKINLLDLGANNGGFPLLLKSEGIEIEKLVCVELNPKTFSRLQFNISRNFDDRYTVLNSAITGTKRSIEILLGRGGVNNNIYENDCSDGTLVKFEGKTFDEVFTQYFDEQTVDLCKMDIESAEFEIFENDNHSKIKNCRYLLIEIHHNQDNKRDAIIERLSDLKFKELDGDHKNQDTHYVHLFENKMLSV